MTTRQLTIVYFWINALLVPLGFIMLAVGLICFYMLISTGQTPRNGWTGSQTPIMPYFGIVIAFVALPIWGMRCCWIHRSMSKDTNPDAGSHWVETALFNLSLVVLWLVVWPRDSNHIMSHWPVFIITVSYNCLVCLFSFWMLQRTRTA